MSDPVTAFAQRIGKITVDLAVLKPGSLKIGDRLLVEVFDKKLYAVRIKSTNDHKGSFHKGSLSARGSVENLGLSVFIISITDNQVLATLRHAEKNILYAITYNNLSGQHYLYETPLDKVDNYQEKELPNCFY